MKSSIMALLKIFMFFICVAFAFIVSINAAIAEQNEWSASDVLYEIFDTKYTPEDLRTIRRQIKEDRQSLLKTFQQKNKNLSNKESIKKFNNLYTSIIKHFNAFVSDFELPERPTTKDVYKWIQLDKKEETQRFSVYQLKSKFDIKEIDQILDLYKTMLVSRVEELKTQIKSTSYNTYFSPNSMPLHRTTTIKYANIIAFFECLRAYQGMPIGLNIDESLFAQSLFYLNTESGRYPHSYFHSMYLLAEAGQQNSASANALLALIYINHYLELTRFVYLFQKVIDKSQYYDILRLREASLFYINNGAAIAQHNQDVSKSIGDFYKLQNFHAIAKKWYQIVDDKIAFDKAKIELELKNNQNINFDSTTSFNKSANFANYYNHELLYKKGWDIIDNAYLAPETTN